MIHSRDSRVYIYSDVSTTSQQLTKPECDNSETYRLHECWVLRYSSLIRWIIQSRDDFRDSLGSEMRYSCIMSIIATSRKTTPTDIWQEQIACDLLQRVQLQSTAVNWAAPSDAESAIDEKNYITPEPGWLTRTQREVTRRWYLSQHGYIARSKSTYEGMNLWEWVLHTISTNTHRDNRLRYKEEDTFPQLTPPKSKSVELIPFLRIQSPIPTTLRTPMVNLRTCKGYNYAELDDC